MMFFLICSACTLDIFLSLSVDLCLCLLVSLSLSLNLCLYPPVTLILRFDPLHLYP